MKLTLVEPKYLKDSISIISELVSETRFKISSTGITVISMDPANVAMVVFKLLSSCFSEFSVPEDMDLGLNLNNLKQILRRVENSDIVTLETDEKASKLNITVKGKTTRRFSIPIIEPDSREQKEPNLEFSVDMTLSASLLSSAIEDADIVADSVAFVADKNKLTVVAEGDLNKVEVDIEESDDAKISNNSEEVVKSKYSLEYLKKMISGSKLSDNVTVMFKENYPIKINFTQIDKVSLGFILAPRVEND